jgi:hypothetical protein
MAVHGMAGLVALIIFSYTRGPNFINLDLVTSSVVSSGRWELSCWLIRWVGVTLFV